MFQENTINTEFYSLTKLSFKSEGEIKTFSKLRDCFAGKVDFKMLDEVL